MALETGATDFSSSPYAEDNFDPRPTDLFPLSVEEGNRPNTRIAVIRTSDRNSFRNCRRAWGWGSHLRGNLGSKGAISPFWLGSGFHFALEDFHGPNIYGTPARAFAAYAVATHRYRGQEALPPSWREDFDLGRGMVSYYADKWLKTRDPLKTFYFPVEGELRPQVEVNFRVQIPFDATHWGYDQVIYSGTLDRVVIDENGFLWILEYKTAKQIQTSHYATDSQVTSYCWAASHLYPDYPLGGVIYQQHRKTLPDTPRILASGKLSTDKRQATDYQWYREAVLDIYQSVESAPAEVVDTLNKFAQLEEVQSNKWVRRDKLERNAHQMQAEGQKILLEVGEMLNPELPLYPNPQRMNCAFCTFQGPCVAMDSGEDWDLELQMFTRPRDLFYDSWRNHLPEPHELKD